MRSLLGIAPRPHIRPSSTAKAEMTMDELQAWAEQHCMVLISADEFDTLCSLAASAASTDIDREYAELCRA